MQIGGTAYENVLLHHVFYVHLDCSYRTNRSAVGRVVETETLSAEAGVDVVFTVKL